MHHLTDIGRGAEEKEELLLVFTHLDPGDPQREFQLGVHVVADNRYTGALTTHAVWAKCGTLCGVNIQSCSAWQLL